MVGPEVVLFYGGQLNGTPVSIVLPWSCGTCQNGQNQGSSAQDFLYSPWLVDAHIL